MSDNLEWMNRHAILLREPQWQGIAARENYRIRADLRPLFDAHADSLELLDAMAAKGLHREGCEFIARMTHRRAAVWWGYVCLLDLFAERTAVASGAVKPASPTAEFEPLLADFAKLTGVKLPEVGSLAPDKIDGLGKAPDVDMRKLLAFPEQPPQDRSALKAATAVLKAKSDKLRAFVPPDVRAAYGESFAKAEAMTRSQHGFGLQEHLDTALAAVDGGRVTYKVDRFSHPTRQALFKLPGMLENQRKETIKGVKEMFPDKYPATPEAALLLKRDARARSDEAVQAVWRWVVSPDERNTTLAMAAGNAVPGTPEGMLAYVAAWSFGDLAPEGKMTVPVPPELPGTGLVGALLMMALAEGGHRKPMERYETYFKFGMDVVFGKNLWPDAVSEAQPPHRKMMDELAKAEDDRDERNRTAAKEA